MQPTDRSLPTPVLESFRNGSSVLVFQKKIAKIFEYYIRLGVIQVQHYAVINCSTIMVILIVIRNSMTTYNKNSHLNKLFFTNLYFQIKIQEKLSSKINELTINTSQLSPLCYFYSYITL